MGTVTAGYTVLHGWQTGGGERTGALLLWGYFRLDDVEDLGTLDQEFKPQEKYRSRFGAPAPQRVKSIREESRCRRNTESKEELSPMFALSGAPRDEE